MYVAPSRFLLEKMVELGLDRGRLRVSPNFIDLSTFDSAFRESFPAGGPGSDDLLYFGRLSPEKGVDGVDPRDGEAARVPAADCG